MMKWFREYGSTFKFNFDFWSTFLVEYIFFGGLWLLFTWFSSYANEQSKSLLQGKSVEQIGQVLAGMSPEQSLAFLSQLQVFLAIMVGGILFFVAGGFLLFGLEQAVIWYHFERKKVGWKTYWKWNVFHLVLIMPLLLYGAGYVLVTLGLSGIFKWVSELSPTLYFTCRNTTSVR